MTNPYAGSNITGTSGLIAVDKVGNHIRFYDPESLREIKSFAAPEPAAHELAISHDRRLAFVPLYGDGIYGNNKKPNNKILVIDLVGPGPRRYHRARRDDGPARHGGHVGRQAVGGGRHPQQAPRRRSGAARASRRPTTARPRARTRWRCCPTSPRSTSPARRATSPSSTAGAGRGRRAYPMRAARRQERQRQRQRGRDADAGRRPARRHRQRQQRPARDRYPHRHRGGPRAACRVPAVQPEALAPRQADVLARRALPGRHRATPARWPG